MSSTGEQHSDCSQVQPIAGTFDDAGLKRAILQITSTQTLRSFPVVMFACAATYLALAGETSRINLLIWLLIVTCSAALAAVVSRSNLAAIETASSNRIRVLLRRKVVTVSLNTCAVGSGFWWVGMGGSLQVIYAIAVISCIYQAGAMVNASIHFGSFVCGVFLNFGQGILFFSGVAGNEPLSGAAAAMTSVAILMVSFGHVNARQFAESIRIRADNVALVAQLAEEKRAVETALATAQDAIVIKNRFLAAASHDLRQPLHALGLFLGSLSLMVEGEEAGKLLRRIRMTTDVLNEHFNSLLDLSRFDSGGIDVNKRIFDIAELLDGLGEESRYEAEAKGLALTVNAESCSVYSDRMLTERVVRNLLSNAVRYTEKGAVGLISERFENRVVVTVLDTGPGIPPDEHAKVFDEFVQLNNPGRKREHGVGLGLAIVRRIDALLSLNLRIRSAVGRGSRFEFDVPLATSTAEREVAFQATNCMIEDVDAPPSGLHVWIVEDDLTVAEALNLQLQIWGCKVRIATTRRGLEEAYASDGHWPDLALIDDMLGEEQPGLEVARWLSVFMPIRNVVMVTGNTLPEKLAEIADSGFPLVLKPMSPWQVADLLREATQPGEVWR